MNYLFLSLLKDEITNIIYLLPFIRYYHYFINTL
jgi:hypothetical protein